MTAEQLIKARLVMVCHRAAGWTGSELCMLAVANVVKNRVDAGWGDWMQVMDDLPRVAGNEPEANQNDSNLDLNDEPLLTLLAEIDDVYTGIYDDQLTRMENPMGGEVRCLYYCFVERPIRDWFAKHIVRQPEEHPRRGQVGQMMLYE